MKEPKAYKKEEVRHKKTVDKENLKHETFHDKAMAKLKKSKCGCKKKKK
jgi:hypothetical protein